MSNNKDQSQIQCLLKTCELAGRRVEGKSDDDVQHPESAFSLGGNLFEIRCCSSFMHETKNRSRAMKQFAKLI
jgi:hypothetical protein